ncbi:MAG TPA: alpha/beta hydrolase-fold protein, partial [Steroidobacteraceae bacterium]
RVFIRSFVFFLLMPATPTAVFCQSMATGTVINESAHFKSLEGNLLDDSPDRSFAVYLPPSYQKEKKKRYPVVYLLHGYGLTFETWTAEPQLTGREIKVANVPRIADKVVSSGSVREMIIVMADGMNKLGGAFYTNSATTGNWEDSITQDLVGYIDRKYRTLARPASRGIAGHSMGGYGAVKLAMKHPEIFGAVYAMSACCLEFDRAWTPASPAWGKALSIMNMDDFVALQKIVAEGDRKDPNWFIAFIAKGSVAVAAAFSPNPERPPFFGDFPIEQRGDTLVAAERPKAAWVANLPVPMLGQYRSNLARLRGIGFDVGKQDFNPDLIVQAHDLDAALTVNGIRHEFEEYMGTHSDKIAERVESKVLPFFSRVLE